MYYAVVIVCLFGMLIGKTELRRFDNAIQTKIIGGQSLPVFQRPFIVSIHRRHNGFVCGGVILSSKWILTALHCIPKPRLNAQFYIRAGSKYYDRGGTYHVFRKMKLYNTSFLSDFGSTIPIHDITIIKVFPEIQFSSKTLPAKLPKPNEQLPRQLWVSGWGLTSSGKISKTLRSVVVDKIANQLCQNMSSVYTSLMSNDRHICYGGIHRDSCNGDSGGPLSLRYTVYGIVSFGEDCGLLPGVYVKLSYYREWILRIILSDK